MDELEVVPGFKAALARTPVLARTHADLRSGLEASWLTRRNRAQVAIAAAARSRCPYALWAQARLARAEGLDEEDIFLASAYMAKDARETAILQFARRVMIQGEAAEGLGYRFPLTTHELRSIIAAVTLSTLVNLVVSGLAPVMGRAPVGAK